MTDTLIHCGLMIVGGIVVTSIAIVFALESIVGLGMIVVALCERLVR